MAWISAVFFCLGAADTLLGDRLGLGSALRQGFAAVVDLLLLMTGFMALAPWLGTHLAPVITPVFSAVGWDPSLFASLFLSCDAGGAVLVAQGFVLRLHIGQFLVDCGQRFLNRFEGIG